MIRSSSRARITDQRGFALISALLLAVLYFGLMELVLVDSQRSLHEAQRFRSRIVALTLAESAAEMAAVRLVDHADTTANASDSQGTLSGRLTWNTATTFTLDGKATTAGVMPESASVEIEGRVDATRVPAAIQIDWARHSQ